MRPRILRGLVNALGERGSLSLPLVPQLQPVIAIDDLAGIGFPIGMPVNAQVATAAVAAQRSAAYYTAPVGYVIRIDRVKMSGSAYSIHFGNQDNFPDPIETWAIVDGRLGNHPLLGVLTGVWYGNSTIAGIQLPEGQAKTKKIASSIADDTWFEGPFYVDSRYGLLVFSDLDNDANVFQAVGEAFETG